MSESPGAWLIVFGEVEGLRWVLKNRRMAFSAATCPRAGRIRPADELVLYVGRGAFHNPTRDRSQIVAHRRGREPVRPFRRQTEIAGREFVCRCDLELDDVLPERQGVPVKPLIPKLCFIRRKEAWANTSGLGSSKSLSPTSGS